MNETEYTPIIRPRVRLLGQPLGLGLPLALAGGFLGFNMMLALLAETQWVMWLVTLVMAAAFLAMFALGISYLLSPFERLRISPEGVELVLWGLTLRRIPKDTIRSVTATTREIIVRRKDCDLYRLKINPNGSWPQNRSLWLDWSVATEEALKSCLPNVNFLF
ncbi:MAG: hypothetical protein ACI4PL_02585 [Faecousia sp.]